MERKKHRKSGEGGREGRKDYEAHPHSKCRRTWPLSFGWEGSVLFFNTVRLTCDIKLVKHQKMQQQNCLLTLLLVSLVAVAAHYGDPNDGGCMSDEQDVRIQGLAG